MSKCLLEENECYVDPFVFMCVVIACWTELKFLNLHAAKSFLHFEILYCKTSHIKEDLEAKINLKVKAPW